ncbi:pyridoxal-phosphate dependent enzyme [Candidatus Acetothermia bacterium]|nr:pyridoxal-phosphate dependent enzyme [Candidatus Acetothermia bacterium]MBI3643118.1 pyridoxal-phosphate dependent enzyme [Candidatus Acetothermia bacterium]
MLTLNDIRAAQRVIAGKLHRTPILTSKTLSEMTETSLYLKAELFQKTGSFKPRGVLNKLYHLTREERAKGLIGVSAGNHAQAVAYAARLNNIKATVVMPEKAVPSKVEATRGYGAEVILHGDMTQLFPKAEELIRERGLVLIHPFDDPKVIAGQGTVGLEILEDVPDAEVVIVPIGGGGLISGISSAIKLSKPKVHVFGVEPEGANSMYRSLREGHAVKLDRVTTIADGLAAPFAGKLAYEIVKKNVDDVVLVSEGEILAAFRLILERCKVLPEPAAAASVAALLSGKIKVRPGAKVVCVLSGGNPDLKNLSRLMES